MAEVLGLVASGLSVAQVAGSILTNSLKLKTMLEEVKDAPENLSIMLDHLELLTSMLSEATIDVGGGPGTISTPLSPSSNLQQALQRAVKACQTAAEQLETFVTDLVSNINAAGGGARRKRAMGSVKVVLKKGVLVQLEMRLQKTVQLLTLAQNTYLIALQRTQPETIISQVKLALDQATLAVHGHIKMPGNEKSCESQIVANRTDGRILTNSNASAWHEILGKGFVNLTGLIRVFTSSNRKNSQTTTSEQGWNLRIQVQMPIWLSESIFDATFSRSYAGWDCSLRVSGHILEECEEGSAVMKALESEDVAGLCRLFQERRCSPWDRITFLPDHLVLAESSSEFRLESSLLEKWALSMNAWNVAQYLLNYGVECAEDFVYDGWRDDEEQFKPYFGDFLKHSMLSDSVRISCLASCPDDINLFVDLVGRVWPSDAFYDTLFQDERLDLAMTLLEELREKFPLPPPATFRHLCESLFLGDADAETTTMVLMYFAFALGDLVWQDPDLGDKLLDRDLGDKWQRAIRDTALRLNKVFVMPGQHLHDYGWFAHRYFQLSPVTPFTCLFWGSMAMLPGGHTGPGPARHHKITSRLSQCEKSLHIWLGILQDCDIDLQEYGLQTKQIMDDEEDGYNFRIFSDVLKRGQDSYENVVKTSKNDLFMIRLISFKYGSQPDDWKLWWSEPTDELVGDFWREMDPEPLWIPGSWVED